jgi:DNA repair protein RecN (Recombination protein N)
VLEEMRIRGLGVIDDAVLELAPGLTVVSGETGAGKTMVVTGLGLLFGGRADPGAVRPGVDTASVEGRLRVDPEGPVARRALDAGAELDEDVLLVARTVSGAGRSRAHLGGRAVPAGTLAELADACVAVHGQSDQTRLRQPARQREALDRYAGAPLAAELADYQAAYDELRSVSTELASLTAAARERAQEADLLRFGLGEIEAGDPQAGEATALQVEEERLGNADGLRAAAGLAHTVLLGAGEGGSDGTDGADAVGLVARGRTALEQVGAHDPVLEELVGRLRELGYLLADVGADLASYAAGVDTDPARLAVVQDRRAELTRLARKYADDAASTGAGDATSDGAAVDQASAVLAWGQRAATRLATLDGADDRIGVLAARRAELTAGLARSAAALSAARSDAAGRFAAQVGAELVELAMPHASLEVAVTQTPDDDGLEVDGRRLGYHRHGVDDVELLLVPHAGAPARPLQRGASGGELSRVMLAIEVTLAGTDPVPTLVFDEVDAGVGGRAAVEVGRRLAALARTAQVVVVTHLPQVAAFADQHLVVRKADDGVVTRSGVVALDEAGRLRELSRMLAGQEESATAEAHARELLETARAAR